MTMTFAGLSLDRPRVMGIVNVTPDSFADAGETFSTDAAVARGRAQMDAGADIIDVGGESTRPGATPVSPDEECDRVLDVVEQLASAGAVVSIDTRHSLVMRRTVEAGAKIINDVSALTTDPDSVPAAADSGAAIILMHMRGDPITMAERTDYADLTGEIAGYLAERVAVCEDAGISRGRLAVDPGFGFAKNAKQNFELLDNLGRLSELNLPVLVGLSRKFGLDKPPAERLELSLSLARTALDNGAQILRVHDVAETKNMVDDWRRASA